MLKNERCHNLRKVTTDFFAANSFTQNILFRLVNSSGTLRDKRLYPGDSISLTNIFPRVRRVPGLINLQRLAKNMLTKKATLHLHMGPVEKNSEREFA